MRFRNSELTLAAVISLLCNYFIPVYLPAISPRGSHVSMQSAPAFKDLNLLRKAAGFKIIEYGFHKNDECV